MGCLEESNSAFNDDEFAAARASLMLDLATADRHDDFFPTYTDWIRDLSCGADAAAAANMLHMGGLEGGERTAVYMLHPNWRADPLRDGGICGELASLVEFAREDAVPAPVIQRRLETIAAQTAGLLFEAQLN